METKNLNFIVIDDSELDCFIAEKIIKHTGRCKEVLSFTNAATALNHIKAHVVNGREEFIIILDVLMPMMNGFAFVEAFEKLPQEVQNSCSIIALTSSMNRNDINRIKGYKTVKRLFDKPITTEAIFTFLRQEEQGK